MKKYDFISITALTPPNLQRLIQTSLAFKGGGARPLLAGRTMALLFQKPSLRTRASFEAAMNGLGGHSIYFGPAEAGIGTREPIEDAARVLCRYVDIIVARTYAHETVEALAAHSSVPVINGLSEREHPCQALGDLMTIQEKLGSLRGKTIAYIGDGNNVATSLIYGAALAGANFRIAAPKGYDLPSSIVSKAQALRSSESQIETMESPAKAVVGADVVYTDVWTSMGHEEEAEWRRRDFARYQVTPELIAGAKPGALFMHPLPAHHGEEISAGLLDHPQSVVFDQAENRMHVQKAILIDLLSDRH